MLRSRDAIRRKTGIHAHLKREVCSRLPLEVYVYLILDVPDGDPVGQPIAIGQRPQAFLNKAVPGDAVIPLGLLPAGLIAGDDQLFPVFFLRHLLAFGNSKGGKAEANYQGKDQADESFHEITLHKSVLY